MPDPQRGIHRLGRRAKRFLSPSQKGGGHPVQNVSASESNRNNAGPPAASERTTPTPASS